MNRTILNIISAQLWLVIALQPGISSGAYALAMSAFILQLSGSVVNAAMDWLDGPAVYGDAQKGKWEPDLRTHGGSEKSKK